MFNRWSRGGCRCQKTGISERLTADRPSSHVSSALNDRYSATADSMCHRSWLS